MATNQDKLNDLWWILCAPDGREEFKHWLREANADPGVLDAQALAVLKRDCDQIDPTTKTKNVTGTTTLAKKINWLAFNFEEARQDSARTRERVAAVESKLDTLIELLTKEAK